MSTPPRPAHHRAVSLNSAEAQQTLLKRRNVDKAVDSAELLEDDLNVIGFGGSGMGDGEEWESELIVRRTCGCREVSYEVARPVWTWMALGQCHATGERFTLNSHITMNTTS